MTRGVCVFRCKIMFSVRVWMILYAHVFFLHTPACSIFPSLMDICECSDYRGWAQAGPQVG